MAITSPTDGAAMCHVPLVAPVGACAPACVAHAATVRATESRTHSNSNHSPQCAHAPAPKESVAPMCMHAKGRAPAHRSCRHWRTTSKCLTSPPLLINNPSPLPPSPHLPSLQPASYPLRLHNTPPCGTHTPYLTPLTKRPARLSARLTRSGGSCQPGICGAGPPRARPGPSRCAQCRAASAPAAPAGRRACTGRCAGV